MSSSMLSLGQAAKLAGVGKTTIQRAVTAGRLSATRRDDGGYAIDPAELARVYDVRPERLEKRDGRDGEGDRPVERDATPRDPELETRLAVAEAQLAGLRQIVDAEKARADAAEKDRDRWAAQAERLALLAPPPAPPAKPGLVQRILGRRPAA